MSLRRFNIYGPKLFQAGFEPIPLKQETKVPVHEGWTRMAVEESQVTSWAANGYGRCGVGIRCGQVKGLDIDVYDHEAASNIAAWIDNNLNRGKPVARRYGARPKFLIPCIIDGVEKKTSSTAYIDAHGKTNQIEILAQGQMFVAYGRHPDASKEYQWEHGCMEDIGLLYLPEFAAIDITGMLFDYFDELAVVKGWQMAKKKKADKAKKKPSSSDPFENLPDPPPEFDVLKRAVNKLPIEICDDYETWVQVGMGIHHSSNGSEQGYQLFDSWSKKSGKYQNEKETRLKWQSFSLDRDADETITFGSILDLLGNCPDVSKKVSCDVNVDNVDTNGQMGQNVDNVDTNGQKGQNVDNVDTNGQKGQFMDRRGQSMSENGQTHGQTNSLYGMISAEIKEYIEFHTGDLVYHQLCQDLGYKIRRDKKAAHEALRRMVENEFIEKHPEKRGVYRPVVVDIDLMTPEKNMEAPLPLPLPLDLGKYIKLLPGSVIVIGGATNAGKTLMAMQMIRDWIRYLSTSFEWTCQSGKFTPSLRECVEGVPEIDDRLKNLTGIRYLNSEMSRHELGNLLHDLGPDGELIQNAVQWVRRSRDFPRAVLTNGITFVDFLQIHKDFYEIGGIVAEMADKVGDGLLVTLIQKKSGEAAPRGGEFALERARLAMMLDYAGPNISSCYLRKVKHPIDYKNNPQGKDIDFRIGKNLLLRPVSDLRRLTKKERERINQQYLLDQQRQEARDDFSNLF